MGSTSQEEEETPNACQPALLCAAAVRSVAAPPPGRPPAGQCHEMPFCDFAPDVGAYSGAALSSLGVVLPFLVPCLKHENISW